MNSSSRILMMVVLLLCMVFSFYAILGGDTTSAPTTGFGKINKGENINDVHSIMQNKNQEIYTLGYTCIQKFSKSGNFMGGVYYDSNSTKNIINNEFLSLNDGKVILLMCNENIIYFFNDTFDIIDKIEVDKMYDENCFYMDYPNTDALDRDIHLSFWGNTVLIDNAKIKLEAPRNRWFSRDIGIITLFATIVVFLLCTKSRHVNID